MRYAAILVRVSSSRLRAEEKVAGESSRFATCSSYQIRRILWPATQELGRPYPGCSTRTYLSRRKIAAMPPPRQPLLPPGALQPRHSKVFDPWNSSASGHQRPDGKGAGVPWREWRNTKLSVQYGRKATKGSINGGQAPVVGMEGREKGGVSVVDMLVRPGAMKGAMASSSGDGAAEKSKSAGEGEIKEKREAKNEEIERGRQMTRGIFDGLVVYVNGSTHPLISDHKLKQVLSENGARMSLHLGRRRVTHVILGRPGTVGRGAGGGLAGGKLEREVKRVGGCGIKYVGVEW